MNACGRNRKLLCSTAYVSLVDTCFSDPITVCEAYLLENTPNKACTVPISFLDPLSEPEKLLRYRLILS
jgi:hypothetical protein